MCGDFVHDEQAMLRCGENLVHDVENLHRVMSPKDADGMANSEGPDQTAPSGS